MDNPTVDTLDLESFLDQLHDCAAKWIKNEEAAALQDFSRRFFNRFALEELQGRHLSDVFGALHHHWRFIQEFDARLPKIHAFNPSLAEDGWLCPHTLLVVLQRDMPFLVDSVRIELNRRNIAIHSIKSTVMTVRRDGGKLQSLLNGGDRGEDSHREALIVLEINRQADTSLRELTGALESVLAEVDLVVADYQPMLEQTRQTEQNLERGERSSRVQHVDESREFLRWLMDNNYTFLGYSEYELIQEKSGKHLRELVDKRLGIFRSEDETVASIAVDESNPGMERFHLSTQVLAFSKSSVRARVHRHAYSDYIVIKRFNEQGEICGESRLLGLYTSRVYTMSPSLIPLIRRKVAMVFERSDLDPDSHDGKALQQILETFPRDELFQSSSSELYDTVSGVLGINERYQVRLFMRPDPFGKFVNAIVYVPRDVFTTRMRVQIQELIASVIHATEYEFTTYFSESILARVHMVFKVDPDQKPAYDIKHLESRIVAISRSWEDHLQDALLDVHGEEHAGRLIEQYRDAFPPAYRDHYEPRTAVQDIASIAELQSAHDISMSFYQPVGADSNVMRFKIFHREETLELSDVIPVLEHLGLRVVSEHPYRITTSDQQIIWLHDFQLSYNQPAAIDVHVVKQAFQDAFAAIWQGRAENDAFNRLVLGARLNWREVVVLRAYATYMRQTLFSFTESTIANALVNQTSITRSLIALFKAKFDPRLNQSRAQDSERIERLRQNIIDALEQVQNLYEDRILRRYLVMLDATLRTNYFQVDDQGEGRDYLSLKFSPRDVPDIPEPRPLYEIFVYSPRMEAVHLRAGKVARGGLRWSDRLQDYRTEVLGLVKAQHVKNAVIVPSGAKGGFVCKRPPIGGDREALQQEAIACYRIFIRGLLDITDNLVEGELVPPDNVVRFDDDDPYLVVAADKGTASFSDIANEISQEYGHWLGDAFASGGSQGYDHKKMGITARGAWVSVQRHFKERGINIQEQDFTVVGIGDMGGDVFGNGMLLSKHICLLAAFNHMHIFIDPSPDPAASFTERERLFNKPRSSWADYDMSLISKGGGVFNRDAKSIKITPQMQRCFAIEADSLTPAELINALLKAPVDLIWNGGIGTYVKARQESHADVGDKSNDYVRVDGGELRCKVFGEGGNLGMTQLGRVEYCLNGGACNTDFIDNAGGVDCSDHEVNVKILLNDVMANGDMTLKQRNRLLVDMTENVAQLVLSNNYHQTQAISLAEAESLTRHSEYQRLMNSWQRQERMDRELEFLPDDEQLEERATKQQGLTRPELAVLVSYAKVILKEDLAETDLVNDDYMVRFIEQAFPDKVRKKYKKSLYQHRLRREILATQIANDMVNNMGISFAQRLAAATGAKVADVAKAYVCARDIHAMEDYHKQLEALDYQVPASLQIELMLRMMRRVRRAARWFLRNRRSQLEPAKEVEAFAPAVAQLQKALPELLLGEQLEAWRQYDEQLREAGLPDELVARSAMPGHLFSGLGVVDAARHCKADLLIVAKLYFALADYLGLHGFSMRVSDVSMDDYWQVIARESYLDDLESQLRTLTTSLVRFIADDNPVDQVVTRWAGQHRQLIERWDAIRQEAESSGPADFAIFSVALRELLDLAQVTQHCDSLDENSPECGFGT